MIDYDDMIHLLKIVSYNLKKCVWIVDRIVIGAKESKNEMVTSTDLI